MSFPAHHIKELTNLSPQTQPVLTDKHQQYVIVTSTATRLKSVCKTQPLIIDCGGGAETNCTCGKSTEQVKSRLHMSLNCYLNEYLGIRCSKHFVTGLRVESTGN